LLTIKGIRAHPRWRRSAEMRRHAALIAARSFADLGDQAAPDARWQW
jgi:hypothetical protein